MKKGNFRLTCVAQKRRCLSSLITEDHTTHPLHTPSFDPQLFVTNVEVKKLSSLITTSPTLSCLKATKLPAVRISQKADLANYKLTITPFVFGAS